MRRKRRYKMVPGFRDIWVSDDGKRVFQSALTGTGRPYRKPVTQSYCGNYLSVKIKDGNNIHRYMRVHRLVLMAFVGLCPEGMIGCHNNDIKNDNRLENLRWDTYSENQFDVTKNGPARRKRDRKSIQKKIQINQRGK